MTILTDGIVRRHPTVNMEILDLLNEESVSGARSWRASEASETLSGLFNRESRIIIICKCYSTGRSDIRDIFHEL